MSAGTPPELARWVGELPAGPAGVLHVAAVWERPDGEYQTLRVGEGAPRSLSDAVVLSGARARADAIVTTGRILRDEPELVHESIAPPEETAALERWREALGLATAPWIAVLTGSGELPAGHPALEAAQRLIVYTGRDGAARLRAEPSTPPHAEIVEREAPSAAGLIEHLRGDRGAGTIVIEAGASTTRALYEGAGLVDELWLSACRAPELDDDDLVGAFVSRDAIEASLGPPVHAESHDDDGLEWATRVHRRAAHAKV
jgi:riboflavin biosynthesis pyrimidine reductase